MRWLLRFRVFLTISLTVLLILTAVIFSAIRVALPHANAYKNEIQQIISRQTGLLVEIDWLDAAIVGFSPRLKLMGVSVFDTQRKKDVPSTKQRMEKDKVPLFTFREAFIELDIFASFMRREIIIADVGMVGATISIEKFSDSEWAIQGIKINLDGEAKLPEQFLFMLQHANYLLHDSTVYYQDHTQGKKLKLSAVNVTVENLDNKHDIKLSVNLPAAYGGQLSLVANLHGGMDALAGQVYIEASQINTKQWKKLLSIAESHQVNAIIDVNLWLTLDNNNLQELTTQFIADDLSITNNATGKRWGTEQLSAKMQYTVVAEGWRVAVSDLHFSERRQATNFVAGVDDSYYYLSADFLTVMEVQALAEVLLGDEHLSYLEQIQSYQIQAEVYNLNFKLPQQRSETAWWQHLDINASVINFSMLDSKNNISLSGFDMFLQVENKRAKIELATQDATVEVKDLFRETLSLNMLRGNLLVDYQDDSWQLSSQRLQLKNSHINTFSRFNIQLTSAKEIYVDAQTNFYDAYGKNTKHYLPVGIMRPALVDWLDMAITDGNIAAGAFILKGKLSDFPYYKNNGVFQVLFSLQDASMQFLEDWPVLTETSATVKFHNQGLFVSEITASTQNAILKNGLVQILDLGDAHLTLSAQARGQAEGLQSYVWNSPLDAVLGDALRLFQLDGESQLTLKLDIPLNTEETVVAIDGQIQFLNTDIYFPDFGYELRGMSGVVHFTEDSVTADSMTATMNSQPVVISAVTQDGRSGREMVFHLDGVMQTDYLLQQFDWLPEDLASGKALWEIDIEIPYNAKDYLVHINAVSLLEGAQFTLSDKVQKQAASKVRFSAEIDVLDNQGLQLVARASTVSTNKVADSRDDIFSLRSARDENKRWTFSVDSAFVSGEGAFTEGLGKETNIELTLEHIDLHALFVSENDENKQTEALNPADFPPLNWQAKKVLWNGLSFANVKIETSRYAQGMLIDTLLFSDADMTFSARGSWLTSYDGVQKSALQGTVTSSNLGNALRGLNLSRSLGGGKTAATFSAKWSAEPHQLSWGNMEGNVSFDIRDGEILDVDPGTGGRLLGLLNIVKLANRLILDFDDVTADGFSFDSMKGNFKFVQGKGSLTNLDVIASTADINMFGSIGLLQQDYDLLLRVKPHGEGLTFAAGALLGGVAVGAGLAIIQKILDIDTIGHNIYTITGSWDDPKVEKIVERSLIDESAEEGGFYE